MSQVRNRGFKGFLIRCLARGQEMEEMETLFLDLLELYQEKRHRDGLVRAWAWFCCQAGGSLSSICLSIFKWRLDMLRSIVKTAWRNIRRQPGYSLINLTGLAVGLSCFILIMIYVNFETGYDRHIATADRVMRVDVKGVSNGSPYELAILPSAVGPQLAMDFNEIEAFTRVWSSGYPVLRVENKAFSEERFFYVDPGFVQVFDLDFLEGDAVSALQTPNSLVMTESAARKYFGHENALGRSIQRQDGAPLLVTGIVPDVPAASHFHYDMLTAMPQDRELRWMGNSDITYILLRNKAQTSAVAAGLAGFIRKHIGPRMEAALSTSLEKMEAEGRYYRFNLVPLRDLHLYQQAKHALEPAANAAHVRIFVCIAMAVLLIACINFTNLATARSARRAREVGIRKTLGSDRRQLIQQFFGETVVFALLALVLAVLLVQMALPGFSLIAGRPLTINLLSDWRIMPGLILLALTVGGLSGVYPALFLSAFQPKQAIESARQSGSRKSLLRNGLVIFQYSVSSVLLVAAGVVFLQIRFMEKRDLGFDKEQLVIIEKSNDLGSELRAFTDALKAETSILGVSNSTAIPGRSMGDRTYRAESVDDTDWHRIADFWTDTDFVDTYGMQMKAGSYFTPEMSGTEDYVVINEAAVKELGLTDAVGQRIYSRNYGAPGRSYFQILGVVKDYHQRSLHESIEPVMMKVLPADYAARYLSVKVDVRQLDDAVKAVKRHWGRHSNNQACELVFFDAEFGRMYEAERRTASILILFALLAVGVACLGLLGLTSFTTEQRSKEVGIRKVLGANESGIALLLTREVFRLLILATLFSWPVAWWLMSAWLNDFAFRLSMPIWVYLISAAAVLGVAALTVAYHVLRLSFINPVKTLRSE